jgi:histidyl-tRNA synthetase
MMSSIQAVKGTRDFFPEAMAYRNWLYTSIRHVSERYGYQEFEAPLIERFELYAAKSGDELVNEQSFVFEDRGGDRVVLRPELTPSLARMIASRSRELARPIRWWSFGPFWRYEKPQRGRSREFFQWNIDLLGVISAQADAEIVAVMASFFKSIGLNHNQVRIKVNNRRLVETQLTSIGIPPSQNVDVFRLIDRKEKLGDSEWREYADRIGLKSDQLNLLQGLLKDEDGWKSSEELVEFFEAAEAHGIEDYIEYEPTVIRGLDYYTGTVFEARDADGSERAILGGGRYDNLVSEVGGEPISGVGYAMGDVVIKLVLEKYELLPELNPNPAEILVTTFDQEIQDSALKLAAELRNSDLKVEWYPQASRLSRQLKYADNQRIPYVAILGPDEIDANTVTIKDLMKGTQESVPRADLLTYLRTLLEQQNT